MRRVVQLLLETFSDFAFYERGNERNEVVMIVMRDIYISIRLVHTILSYLYLPNL